MKVLLLLWLSLAIDLCISSDCPVIYKRFSTDHTFCRKSDCKVLKTGITDEDKKLILKIHNERRSKIATGNQEGLPTAANMVQMEWDDELAAVAQAHANLCEFEHDRNDQRIVENFPVGQNLLQSYGQDINWDMVKLWYDSEVEYFNSQAINPFVFEASYGHFSQLIWSTTWKVGCGAAVYENNGPKVLYTCNYGPAGNWMGGMVYSVGEQCSQCPLNTKCSTEFKGLCKSVTPDGPQPEKPSTEDFLLYCTFGEENPKECDNVKITGSKSLETRKIYTGEYKTVILNGGEKISIDFGKFQHPKGICPFIIGRYGSNVAGESSGVGIKIKFLIPGASMPPSIQSGSARYWRKVGMLMMYGGKMGASITVEAKPGSTPQFFDIKTYGIGGGKCP